MLSRISRLWPFGRRQPHLSKVNTPKFRKYRQFKFVVDGQEHIVQSDYRDQTELNALTETWARGQAGKLWPKALACNLTEVHDFAEPL